MSSSEKKIYVYHIYRNTHWQTFPTSCVACILYGRSCVLFFRLYLYKIQLFTQTICNFVFVFRIIAVIAYIINANKNKTKILHIQYQQHLKCLNENVERNEKKKNKTCHDHGCKSIFIHNALFFSSFWLFFDVFTGGVLYVWFSIVMLYKEMKAEEEANSGVQMSYVEENPSQLPPYSVLTVDK